jgi:hypothetical protein
LTNPDVGVRHTSVEDGCCEKGPRAWGCQVGRTSLSFVRIGAFVGNRNM